MGENELYPIISASYELYPIISASHLQETSRRHEFDEQVGHVIVM